MNRLTLDRTRRLADDELAADEQLLRRGAAAREMLDQVPRGEAPR